MLGRCKRMDPREMAVARLRSAKEKHGGEGGGGRNLTCFFRHRFLTFFGFSASEACRGSIQINFSVIEGDPTEAS
jgi:hypothetical protein